MKLAVIGSRGITDYDFVKRTIINEVDVSKITLIVSGGARGPDSLAETFAKENNVDTKIFKPDWAKYGKGAGMIRNKDIIKEADMIIAFWDGVSKGTKNSIDVSRKLGKEIRVIKV